MIDSNKTRSRILADFILIGIFLLGLWLPLIDNLLHIDPAPDLYENRYLAPYPDPEFSWKSLNSYPDKFEDYYNDHFGFRKSLIRWHNGIKIFGLGVSPRTRTAGESGQNGIYPEVILGKKEWLFFGQDGLIEDYRGQEPLSIHQLEQWRIVLEQRRDWLSRQGIEYLVVIVPNKQTIYPEYLPNWITRYQEKTRLDQMIEYFNDHTDFKILDLRDALLQEKGEEELYYRTDTHWNALGAFFGYQEISERLSERFPQIQSLPLSDFTLSQDETEGLDLAARLGLKDLFSDREIRLTPKHSVFPKRTKIPRANPDIRWSFITEVDNPELPKAVVFCDSFILALDPYLREHFQRIAFYRFSRYDFDVEIIQKEKPDLVIHEFIERYAVTHHPVNPSEVLEHQDP